MDSVNFNYLPRAMTAATIRHEIISHNIANINTPNYRKSSVEFEDLLAREIYGNPPDGQLQMARTHKKHLPPGDFPFRAEPTINEEHDSIMRTDDNNVDIDIEMSTLAKNQLYYNAIATQLGSYITKMRNVIQSGGQS